MRVIKTKYDDTNAAIRISDAISLLNEYGLLNWKKYEDGNDAGVSANVTLILSDTYVRVQDANEETLPIWVGDPDPGTCMPFAYFAENTNADLHAVQVKFDDNETVGVRQYRALNKLDIKTGEPK